MALASTGARARAWASCHNQPNTHLLGVVRHSFCAARHQRPLLGVVPAVAVAISLSMGRHLALQQSACGGDGGNGIVAVGMAKGRHCGRGAASCCAGQGRRRGCCKVRHIGQYACL